MPKLQYPRLPKPKLVKTSQKRLKWPLFLWPCIINCMEEIEFESLNDYLRSSLIEILIILYAKGIDKVHIGSALRLLGLETKEAGQFDNMELRLDSTFENYIFGLSSDLKPIQQVPKNQVLH